MGGDRPGAQWAGLLLEYSSALTDLLAAVTDSEIYTSPAAEPLTGSTAAQVIAGDELLETFRGLAGYDEGYPELAYKTAALQVAMAIEHLWGVAALLGTGRLLLLPISVLARAAGECASAGTWILNPDDPVTVAYRGALTFEWAVDASIKANHELHDNERLGADAAAQWDEHRDNIAQVRADLRQLRTHLVGTFSGGTRPSSRDLWAAALTTAGQPAGAEMWRVMSEAAHGNPHGAERLHRIGISGGVWPPLDLAGRSHPNPVVFDIVDDAAIITTFAFAKLHSRFGWFHHPDFERIADTFDTFQDLAADIRRRSYLD
jgi:hypothetical protein